MRPWLEDEFRALADSVRQRKKQQAAEAATANGVIEEQMEEEDGEDGRTERSYDDGATTDGQGLTRVHFSAQPETPALWSFVEFRH